MMENDFVLDICPVANGNSIAAVVHQNGDSLDAATSDESNQGPTPLNGNGAAADTPAPPAAVIDEDTTTSFTDNSPPSIQNDETNDSLVSDSTKDSVVSDDSNSIGFNKRPLDEDDSNAPQTAPVSKKMKDDIGDKWQLRAYF